jgi:PAS domain S-box-containing protein/putative nucleotidyltransferase with HDIG domain
MKILIVDDTPINQRLLRAQLEAGGHLVLEATDGLKALEILEKESVDVLISDILMANMDGYRLCHEIRKHPKLFNLPIIFYTATYTSREDETLSYGIGADLYLRKPAFREEMERGIITVLEKRAALVSSSPTVVEGDLGAMKGYNEALVKKLERKFHQLGKTHDALSQSEERYRGIAETAGEGIWTLDQQELTTYVNPKMAQMLGYSLEEMLGKPTTSFMDLGFAHTARAAFEGRAGDVAEKVDIKLRPKDGSELWAIVAASPIVDKDKKYIGALAMVTDITERKKVEQELSETVQKLAASEKHNRSLYQSAERRLSQTIALRSIDKAIASSLDLKFTLGVILEQAMSELQVDAAYISLYDPNIHFLEFYVGKGFRTSKFSDTPVRMGAGIAGEALLERKRFDVANVSELTGSPSHAAFIAEDFVDYHVVPLIAKGLPLGVMGIFKRTLFDAGPEWLDYFETLAGQAALAIDSISLFEGLQTANDQLVLGYDATIEGWSRAMDLRDKETEGHTQRVTDLAILLARQLGTSDEDLVHLRRGALLHDIGKMGVPDNILHKPGKLSEDEWVVMKKHPQQAYDMLAPISYLKEALKIPYYHHEKWDGSGYPNGLKDINIPLSARIFSVVDVYDALTSDRPYRKAWPREQALDYIKEQAGVHFDPQITDAFLKSKVWETADHSMA